MAFVKSTKRHYNSRCCSRHFSWSCRAVKNHVHGSTAAAQAALALRKNVIVTDLLDQPVENDTYNYKYFAWYGKQ